MFQPKRLALVATFAVTGCGAVNTTIQTYPNATLTVSPQVTSVAIGSSTIFTANVSNDPNTPYWNLNTTAFSGTTGGSLGTINNQAATSTPVTATTVTYVAPSTPPIYTGGLPSQQGTVIVTATEISGFLQGLISNQTIHITAPTVAVGLTPATASVALGVSNSQTFLAYAVGAVDNGVTLQVNGITGGNSTVGTISATGVYNAPATMPMSGNTITITLISTADPTKTATATVTLH